MLCCAFLQPNERKGVKKARENKTNPAICFVISPFVKKKALSCLKQLRFYPLYWRNKTSHLAMYFTVAVLVLLVGTVVNAAPISHTIKMNVSDVEESPLPAFFFLEVRARWKKRGKIYLRTRVFPWEGWPTKLCCCTERLNFFLVFFFLKRGNRKDRFLERTAWLRTIRRGTLSLTIAAAMNCLYVCGHDCLFGSSLLLTIRVVSSLSHFRSNDSY